MVTYTYIIIIIETQRERIQEHLNHLRKKV